MLLISNLMYCIDSCGTVHYHIWMQLLYWPFIKDMFRLSVHLLVLRHGHAGLNIFIA